MRLLFEVNVQILDFGNSVPATVTTNEDGSFRIYINARLSYERRLEVYQHEMRHICCNDFSTDKTVDKIEVENEH